MMPSHAIRRFLERYFDVVPTRSDNQEIVFVCPVPGCGDQSGHRGVNVSNGLTYCFKCNRGGHIVPFLRNLGYDVEPLRGIKFCPGVKRDPGSAVFPKSVELPQGFTTLADDGPIAGRPHSVYFDLIEKMAVRKRLLIRDLIEAKAGYTRVDPRWEAFCIFPVYSYGRVVYFQGRAYDDSDPDQPNKRFPTKQETGLGASFWIYGEDELILRPDVRRVVVVESILNVLSLRKKFRAENITDTAVVSTFSSRVSDWQWPRLLRVPTLEEICLLFDADATDKAWDEAQRGRVRHLRDVRISIAEMPYAPETKADPNDDPDAAYTAWQNRTEFSTYALMKRKALKLYAKR
jgi:hypothetical protein